jgi:hypothetical protein
MAIGGAVLATGAAILVSAGAPSANPVDEPGQPSAAALPTPKEFVSGLDLECYETNGPALNLTVQLTHLNPVLLQLGLPAHAVVIRNLVETCVPVMKNGVTPPANALPFLRHVDLACYKVESAALPASVPLTLHHLNPVLAQLDRHVVKLVQPDTLCLPVMKNNVLPPTEVLNLVRYLDLECWNTTFDVYPPFTLNLHQLNPQLTSIPRHDMTLVSDRRKMCVPVRKNNQVIPADVLNIIRWVDLERFAASPQVGVPATPLVLGHLNPLFTTLPPVQVSLQRAIGLMVPVGKNGTTPP